jgi:hypothetical protein
MNAEPQQEHRWLEKFVGNWTYESEAAEPGQPSATYTGTESVRSLAGLWIVAESKGDTPGGMMGESIMTIGFDPDKKRFVGSFIGSMMSNLWVYDGELDPTGMRLMLDSEGPSFTGSGTSQYRDVIAFLGDDVRTMTSFVLGEDGAWSEFMKSTYRRTV